MIWWNGKCSDDFGVVVESYPSLVFPKKKYTASAVPGRSGDIVAFENAYENYTQAYDVYISAERNGLPFSAPAVASWLGAPGYHRLEDDYFIDHYRLAYVPGGEKVANTLNLFGRATLEFNCKPQMYLKSGDIETEFTAAGTIFNPTTFASKPLIIVTKTPNTTVTITINGVTLTLSASQGGSALVYAPVIVIDCETQNSIYEAYSTVPRGSFNRSIIGDEYPTLVPGINEISFSAGISSVKIVPRWWTL